MPKVTKTPKKITLQKIEDISYHFEYTCPSCKVKRVNYILRQNVTRFLCDCGQELAVEKIEEGTIGL